MMSNPRATRLSLLACVLLAHWLLASGCAGRERAEREGQKAKTTSATPSRLSHSAVGQAVVKLDPATRERMGLRTTALTAQSFRPQLTAYGMLEQDPSRSFVLRAPVAGILHASQGRAWPAIGQSVADGALVGAVEPRFVPTDRVTLADRLISARAEAQSLTASVDVARSAYQRARTLNADNKNVSDRAVEEAAARFKGEEARLAAAQQVVRLIESSLAASSATGFTPLKAEQGGEVVEVLALPGESVESGTPILRLAKLDRLLARVHVPPGERVPAAPTSARIVPVGSESQPVRGELVALGATVDARAQGVSLVFLLDGTRFGLRPGQGVTAYLDLPEPARQGVVIPYSAIVRYAGNSFAYGEVAEHQFSRRAVALDAPVAGGYFVTSGFSPRDRVVTAAAQALLSEELKYQVAVEK